MLKIFTKKDKRNKLEKEIESVLAKMSLVEPSTDEYQSMTKNLEVLYKAKSYEKDRHISADTIAVVVGNLVGIILILYYEKADIITSKALGHILRGRV